MLEIFSKILKIFDFEKKIFEHIFFEKFFFFFRRKGRTRQNTPPGQVLGQSHFCSSSYRSFKKKDKQGAFFQKSTCLSFHLFDHNSSTTGPIDPIFRPECLEFDCATFRDSLPYF